jgi:hypothetical protein
LKSKKSVIESSNFAKRWTVDLSLILGGLVVGALTIEMGLRIFGISYPFFYTEDGDRGLALVPEASGWWRREGEAYAHINRDGLRDREHSKVKPENTLRFAILGDSYAEALQVPMEKAFWAVMERELEGCEALIGRKVEVINFGVAGYGTAQELITLRRYVWDYSPDRVVLAFTTGNDIRNNSRALEPEDMRPFFIYSNGHLVLDKSFVDSETYRSKQSWFRRVIRQGSEYSRILQAIRQVKGIMQERRTVKTLLQKNRDSNSAVVAASEVGLDNAIYSEPIDPTWQEAWRITEGLLILMRDEVVEKGVSFWVVTLSNDIQVNPDPQTRQQFMKRLGIQDLFYADLRIKALGKKEGFPVLNLAQPLQTYAEKNRTCLHGFDNTTPCGGHWNIEGHRIAGKLIAQELCENLKEPH